MSSKALRTWLGPKLPAPLGRAPYRLALALVRARWARSGEPSGLKLWARHSYRLGTLVPLVSDLDLTAWFEREPEEAQIRELTKSIWSFRRLVPFVGELNVYSTADLPLLRRFGNFWELSRDPELLDRIGADRFERRESDRLAFLLRMLEADAINLHLVPEVRRKKWAHHLHSAGMAPPVPFNLDNLIGALGFSFEATSALRSFLLLRAQGKHYEELKAELSRHPDWGWLYPHRFCFIPEFKPKLADSFQTGILEAQLRWEIPGILSQLRTIPDRLGLEHHLRTLIDLVDRLAPDLLDPEIRNAVAELQRRSQRSRSR